MIFKRFAANLRAQNWLAIGIELGIVVVGVFIGTQVSNWNARRLERVETERMLAQLAPELKAQVDFYETAKGYYATTRRYADIALKAWAGDRSIADRDFVIAAYQASQIQGAGINSDAWANIFGADRLSSVDNPVVRQHLSFLMASDNSAIGVNAVDTPYRRNVRRVIPIGIQDAIRGKCGDYTPADRINVVILPEQCDLALPAADASAAAAALRAHPELAQDLNWHMAAEAAWLANLATFESTTRTVLREMKVQKAGQR